ncbi:MAG: 7-carboxy-7-deazaguanine synthase QueE [Planctomycetes bacterium]|nr:7-carboxy-7-deazaguanine synthase QueE [Planctomycetota bacterium]
MDLEGALRGLQQKKQAADREAKEARAPLIEIFHSIQGEGRFVGVPMAFLRVATCPFRCLYCDTPNSYEAPPVVPVDFGVRKQHEPNPVRASRAAELVRQVTTSALPGQKVQRVSVTGGEPLVFPEFVQQFGKAVRDHGVRLHLETAAHDPDALAACINQVDHLSADYKLPETLAQPVDKQLLLGPGDDHGARHVRCCELALRRGATVDVKIVLTPEVSDLSFERALEQLQGLRSKVLLVLQPVTPFGACKRALPARDLERYTATAVRHEFDVRVVPQTHKQLNLP